MQQVSINLHQLVLDKINEIGNEEESAKLFKRGVGQIRKLISGTAEPGASMCQLVLDEQLTKLRIQQVSGDVFKEPPRQGVTIPPPEGEAPIPRETTTGDPEIIAAGLTGKAMEEPARKEIRSSPYAIMIPTNRDFNFSVMMGILGNWKSGIPSELREHLPTLDGVKDTQIHHARNSLAQRFLDGGKPWSIWFDSDNIVPTGNPSWFRAKTGKGYPDEFLSESALERLTKHGAHFVGGIYVERNGTGEFLVAGARKGDTDAEGARIIDDARKGPTNRLVARPWLAFGCVAVHRKVFTDIMEKRPDLAPKVEGRPWAFFTPYEGGPHGEDVTFARHAIEAGHQPMLDCGLIAGHLGVQAFMP